MIKFHRILLFALINCAITAQKNFTTSGNAIRHTVAATVQGKTVLYVGELDGSISSYSIKGKKIWSKKAETPAVLFEIEASDINNDGNDDLLAANANGTIYCYDSTGVLLWEFKSDHKIRFSEIAVVKNDTKIQIFAGGNDYILYELNAQGELVSTTKIKGVIRKIEAGNFLKSNKQSLFIMTYSHDKHRWEFMGFLDPIEKEIIKSIPTKDKRVTNLRKAMVTDIDVADINKDGKEDILFFGDNKFKPYFIGLDSNFNVLAEFQGVRKESQRYAHSQGTFIARNKEIMFQFGGILYVLDTKGNLKGSSGKRYGNLVHSDFTVDLKSNQLIAAGEVDGGNGIYFYNLNKNSWWNTSHKKQGRMVAVKQNLNTLYNQALNFKLPSYQKRSNKEWVMITSKEPSSKVKKLKGGEMKFVIQKSPKESTNRYKLVSIIGDKALKKDKRGKYQDSRKDIIQMAKDYESQKQPFTFWAGHGNDPFYIHIETLEKVLEVAPNTCYGFVYAEMDNVTDPRVIHFVKEYMPRLAKAIRKHNKAKIYFRYKNMFWAATSHLPLWKELLFSKKYNDILAPASEDTSNRIQDLNLAGRVGMHSGGYVDDFVMRLVDDNPTSWRPLSPGGQNSVSPYLRQGVMMAAYGARYGILFNNHFLEDPGLDILFALMKSGVLPIVEKENILSLGSWHLIKEVDESLLKSVDHHHSLKQYKKDDENAVFSVSQMHWAGTNTPNHDFSKAALGVNYRWLNFIPELPNGMVAIGPEELKPILKQQNIPYSISNAKIGFNGENKIPANKFGTRIAQAVAKGKKNLDIIIEGASWSAVKIDNSHTRLILMDQGYIDPQNRDATIFFKNRIPKIATDILSKNNITINNNNSIKISVPAGSIKFIDVSY